ncbi:unnamed protein product [Ranitomeya imitator]|uniref:Uncharacterized protein n=1 Tax=Ranitomeya imitator TaxID=111125 RepID=A0ABN9MGW1_9NEOB|nr:unnamed protein product [Ranitomeya imitator]
MLCRESEVKWRPPLVCNIPLILQHV